MDFVHDLERIDCKVFRGRAENFGPKKTGAQIFGPGPARFGPVRPAFQFFAKSDRRYRKFCEKSGRRRRKLNQLWPTGSYISTKMTATGKIWTKIRLAAGDTSEFLRQNFTNGDFGIKWAGPGRKIWARKKNRAGPGPKKLGPVRPLYATRSLEVVANLGQLWP